MRSHSALYVDAGYLIAAAATRATGSSFRRGVVVDYAPLIAGMAKLVEERTGLPLLRVYWYDAARSGIADADQEQIAGLPRVKLRLGRVGVDGEQKGVDLRIGLDMVGHSRNGAIDTIYLLSGDDDLTEAVEEAQAQGVQVITLAVPSRGGEPHGISRHLVRASDGLEVLASELLDSTVSAVRPEIRLAPATDLAEKIPTPADVRRRAPAMTEPRRDAVVSTVSIRKFAAKTYAAWSATATPAQREELVAGRPTIPRDLDRALLVDLSEGLGEFNLSDEIRVLLRGQFWEAVDAD